MRIRDACGVLADRFGFTARERDLLFALSCGTTSAPDLASRLLLRPNTIHNHLKGMFRRAGVGSKSELLALLLQSELDSAERHERFRSSTPVLLAPGCESLAQPLSQLGLRTKRCSALSPESLESVRPAADVLVAPWTSAEHGQRVRERVEKAVGRGCLCLFVRDDHAPSAPYSDKDAGPLPMHAHRVAFEVMLHRADGPYERSRLLRVDCDLHATIDDRVETSLWNLGFGGAFVKLRPSALEGSARVRIGDEIRMSVVLPDESSIHLGAQVVWARVADRPAWPSGLGVQFTSDPLGQIDRVQEFVRLARLSLMQPTVVIASHPASVAS
jgi:DNA-binding CsgD family transcriptional regulator/Tfp pilus assembly protein PilZ